MFLSHYPEGELGHLCHKNSPIFEIIFHGIHKTVLLKYGTEQEIFIEKTEIFLPIEDQNEIDNFIKNKDTHERTKTDSN